MEKKNLKYQVWSLGYNKNQEITDFAYMYGEYDNKQAAIGLAEQISIKQDTKKKIPNNVKWMLIQVETVRTRGSWEENIDTVYEEWYKRSEW